MTESPKPLGMSDFFALEAGEYLERLDGMLAKGDSPSADEVVRLARALRGSALMANQAAIARAAAGLEVLARAVREGRRAWDPQTQQLALRAVDDLKIFVRRVGSWTDADTARAEALAVELEQVAGRPSAQIRAVEALGLDAGARAFVAREGAAIAGALERAAQALRANPRAHDPLQHVLRALQPLRGLAALTDLPPLPDLLEGIERAIGELSRSGLEPPTNLGELFQVAGIAIARAAREVAERGRPDPEGPDFRQFAGLLVKFMESEPDAVSIGSLYYSDSGPHIVSRGVPAARPSTLGRLELVSHGEHLRHAARAARSHAGQHVPRARERGWRYPRRPRGSLRRGGARGGGERARREPRRRVRGGAAARGRPAHALELRRRGGALRRARSPDRADPRAGWPGCDPDRADRGARGRPGAAARAPASRTAASADPAARAAPAPRTRPAHRAPRGPAQEGRSGRTGARDAGPRRLVGGVPTAAARRHRPRIARGADRRPGRAGRAAGGVAAGGRCPHAVVPRRPGAQARAGAARRGAHRVGRFAPGPRRRSLRPRCPRFRAQPRPVAAHPPRAGRGSWGSRSRSGCSRGRCTVWTQASWWDTCGAPTHCCCWSPWRWRR